MASLVDQLDQLIKLHQVWRKKGEAWCIRRQAVQSISSRWVQMLVDGGHWSRKESTFFGPGAQEDGFEACGNNRQTQPDVKDACKDICEFLSTQAGMFSGPEALGLILLKDSLILSKVSIGTQSPGGWGCFVCRDLLDALKQTCYLAHSAERQHISAERVCCLI